MNHIALDIVKVKKALEEPEFAGDCLLMPESYFDIFVDFHDKVCTELEALNYSDFMHRCLNEGVGPSNGFPNWVGESCLVIWIACLKLGYQANEFCPKQVAATLNKVSNEMFYTLLLSRGGNSTMTH